MKKTFKLTHPNANIKYPRLVDMVRRDVNRYLKRERRKELPDGYDYWDFDCKYGDTESSAETIHVGDIGEHISDAEERKLESFYLEILSRAAKRKPREGKKTAVPPDAASPDKS